jgi:hypothetical protein
VEGPSRGPPGPKRERRPCQGAPSERSQSVSGASHSGRSAGQQILFNPLNTELDRLRAENSRRDRLTAGLRELCGLGRRAVVEFILDFAGRAGAIELLEPRTAEHNARLDRKMLAITGGDRFAPPCVHAVRGEQ